MTGYILLVLGIVLFAGAHWFKRLYPTQRAAMGDVGKGAVAVALLAAVVLMVLGYRAAPFIGVWAPPAFMVHVANVLILIAFWFFALSMIPGTMSARVRHKQLTAAKAWAIAHLLVNGDLAAIILFGGLLAWAVGSVIIINKTAPDWDRPTPVSVRGDVIAGIAAIIAYGVVAMIHTWLGVYPFPTY